MAFGLFGGLFGGASSNAYISIPVDSWINEKNNQFSVDGGARHHIYGGSNAYKLAVGKHTITIISGTGESWEVTADIHGGELLIIKVVLNGEDICDVMYKKDDATYIALVNPPSL